MQKESYISRINAQNSRSVSYLAEDMDRAYESMVSILDDFERNQVLFTTKTGDDITQYHAYKQMLDLTKYRISQSDIVDIGIYHEQLPWILASSGSYSLENYAQIEAKNLSSEELKNLLDSENTKHFEMTRNRREHYMVFTMPLTRNPSFAHGSIIFLFDYSMFTRDYTFSGDSEVFVVASDDDGIIFNTQDMHENQSLVETAVYGEKDTFIYDGRQYVRFQAESSYSGITHTIVYRYDNLYSSIDGSNITYLFIILGCLALGILLIYLSIRWNYFPIRELYKYAMKFRREEIQNDKEEDQKHESVKLSSIKDVISRLDQEIKEQDPIIKKQQILDILKDNETDVDSLYAFASQFHLVNDGWKYAILVIDTSISQTDIENEIDLMSGQLTSEIMTYTIEDKLHSQKITILSIQTDFDMVVRRISSMLVYEFENNGITIGVSNIHTSVDNISTAYLEALTAISYKFIKGKNSIIKFESVKGENESHNDRLDNLVRDFIIAIRNDDKENMTVIPQDIIEEMKTGSVSLFQAKKISNQIIDEVIKICIDSDVDYKKYISMDRSFIQVSSFETIDDIINVIEQIVQDIIVNIDLKNKIRYKERLNSIVSYIEEHCSDPNLSIESIADEFGISYSHLCKIFKNYYNSTVLNYINNCRLKKAKELLTTTDMMVQKIAQAVGYLNIVSFNRMFKKCVRMTPVEYRDKYRKNS